VRPAKKKYAAGSHKTWGGWETRVCAGCSSRIVLSRGSAIHCFNHGRPFSICQDCFGLGLYGKFYGVAA
jgi:hypothetical protein